MSVTAPLGEPNSWMFVVDPAEAIETARAEFDVREMYAGKRGTSGAESVDAGSDGEALFRTRTGDPLLTMEVLYQLS
jgi:hypothetical protein